MKKLLFLMAVLLPVAAIAQSNYQDGYIIKSNGDTLKGFINYKEWSYSPENVEFKTRLSDLKPQQFNPSNIKGFGVNNESYISFTGLISMNKNVFPNIPTALDTTRQPGAIFIRPLTTGDHLTLFTNTEVNKNRFFVAEKNSTPVELKYYEYYGDSGTDEVTDNLYRGQLILYVYKYNNGDKKLLDAIEDTRFVDYDLKAITDKINNVSLKITTGIPTDTAKKSKVRFFVGTGINSISTAYSYSLLRTFNHETDVIYGTSSSSQVKPRFSLGLDVFNNPDIQQFVFRTEITVAPFSGTFQLPTNNTSTTTITGVNLAYTGYYLSLTPQMLFNFYNKPKFKLYVDIGMGLNMAGYSSNLNGSDQSYINGPATNLYFPIQAGVIIAKRFELSFTYVSFTTAATYAAVRVSNESTTNIGLRIYWY